MGKRLRDDSESEAERRHKKRKKSHGEDEDENTEKVVKRKSLGGEKEKTKHKNKQRSTASAVEMSGGVEKKKKKRGKETDLEERNEGGEERKKAGGKTKRKSDALSRDAESDIDILNSSKKKKKEKTKGKEGAKGMREKSKRSGESDEGLGDNNVSEIAAESELDLLDDAEFDDIFRGGESERAESDPMEADEGAEIAASEAESAAEAVVRELRDGQQFTKAEDKKLLDALEEYVETHFPGKELNIALQELLDAKSRKRFGLWEDLHRLHFRDRSAKALYDHARRRFNARNYKGSWTEEEKNQLRDFVALNGPDYRTFGDRVGRMPGDVKDQWRRYVVNTGPWSAEEDARLEMILRSMHNNALPAREAKLPWTDIAKRMGTRGPDQVLYHWSSRDPNYRAKLQQRLAARSETQWRPQDDRMLITKMWFLPAQDRSELVVARLSRSKWTANKVGLRIQKLFNLIRDSRIMPYRRVLRELLRFFEMDKISLNNLRSTPEYLEW